jgi:hypothetical protein
VARPQLSLMSLVKGEGKVGLPVAVGHRVMVM